MGKSSGSAADVMGAAEETGEQARLLNQEQTEANRPNQNNAWGSTSWEQMQNPDGSIQWTQNETLNPLLQQSLDSQMRIGAGRSSLAEGAMARAYEDYSNPMDFDQFGDPTAFNPEAGPQNFNYDEFDYDLGDGRQAAEDAAYGRATARLDPEFESRQADLESDLRNKGLRAGDQAYDSAMASLGRERTDAYDMARMGAVGEGRTESQMAFDQARTLQGTQFGQGLSSSELNASLQGQRYNQDAQTNQIANALRQQNIQEELGKRGFNLQELESLLSGQMIEGGPPSSGASTSTGGGESETIATKLLGG